MTLVTTLDGIYIFSLCTKIEKKLPIDFQQFVLSNNRGRKITSVEQTELEQFKRNKNIL